MRDSLCKYAEYMQHAQRCPQVNWDSVCLWAGKKIKMQNKTMQVLTKLAKCAECEVFFLFPWDLKTQFYAFFIRWRHLACHNPIMNEETKVIIMFTCGPLPVGDCGSGGNQLRASWVCCSSKSASLLLRTIPFIPFYDKQHLQETHSAISFL